MQLGIPLSEAIAARPLTPDLALLAAIRQSLTALYGDRLLCLSLVGSRARGDHRPDSDWDVLLILDACEQPVEASRIEPHRLELQRQFGLGDVLSLSPLTEDQFNRLDRKYEGIAQNFRRDAIDLLAEPLG